MRENSKTIIKILLMLLPVLVVSCILLMNDTTERSTMHTLADSDFQTVAKEYTDTQKFEINGAEFDIRQYKTDFYNTTADYANQHLTVSGDDPITAIIPRAAFTSVGQNYYLGKEYGFYVNTFADCFVSQKASYTSTKNLHSIVLVFDISYCLESFGELPYLYSYKVEPLFQMEYMYLALDNEVPSISRSAKYGSKYFSYRNSLQKNQKDSLDLTAYKSRMTYSFSAEHKEMSAVVPAPVKYGKDGFDFSDREVYYLQGVSFFSVLANEQNVNFMSRPPYPFHSDEDDFGMFFTDTWYSINGYEFGHGELNKSKVCSKLSQMTHSLSMGSIYNENFVKLVDEKLPAFSKSDSCHSEVGNGGEYSEMNEKYHMASFWQTKNAQLSAYDTLLRTAKMEAVGYAHEYSLWLGVGNSTKAEFKLGVERVDWRMRSLTGIKLSVVSEENVAGISMENSYKEILNDEDYETIELDETKLINVFSDGKAKYTFVAKFTGHYTLDFDEVSGFCPEIKQSNSAICPIDGKYLLEKDTEYKIEITSGTAKTLGAYFSIKEAIDTVTEGAVLNCAVPESSTLRLSLSAPNAGVYNAVLSNENIKMGYCTKYGYVDTYVEKQITMNMPDITYLFISNTSASVQTTDIAFSTLTPLVFDEEGSATVRNTDDEYMMFYRLDLTADAYYYIEINDILSPYLSDWQFFGGNGGAPVNISLDNYTASTISVYAQIVNGIFYIGIKNVSTYKITAKQASEAGEWYINDIKASKCKTSLRFATIKRAGEYSIEFRTDAGTVLNQIAVSGLYEDYSIENGNEKNFILNSNAQLLAQYSIYIEGLPHISLKLEVGHQGIDGATITQESDKYYLNIPSEGLANLYLVAYRIEEIDKVFHIATHEKITRYELAVPDIRELSFCSKSLTFSVTYIVSQTENTKTTVDSSYGYSLPSRTFAI